VVDKSPDRIHFWADGNEIILAHIVAANITVKPSRKLIPEEPLPSTTLRDVKPGQRAKVASIARACRGPMRRRLLDLGIVPGTVVTVEREAPGGDPVAYRIRGATIALRENQARFIHVEPQIDEEA
jgi:DtxR family Mn-dependent transcriptional regulator